MFNELKSWFHTLVAANQVETDEAEFVGQQAAFLLSQAALVGAPEVDAYALDRLAGQTSPYGYINPLTLEQYFAAAGQSWKVAQFNGVYYTVRSFVRGSRKPTKWIPTTLLPEGTLIMTSKLMPGIEALVAEQEAKEEAAVKTAQVEANV